MSEQEVIAVAAMIRRTPINRDQAINLQAPAFRAAKMQRDALAAAVVMASKRWNAIAGIGSGPMGLTPDAVKFSPEYRAARAAYERAHAAAAKFNRSFCKAFARELREERRQRGSN